MGARLIPLIVGLGRTKFPPQIHPHFRCHQRGFFRDKESFQERIVLDNDFSGTYKIYCAWWDIARPRNGDTTTYMPKINKQPKILKTCWVEYSKETGRIIFEIDIPKRVKNKKYCHRRLRQAYHAGLCGIFMNQECLAGVEYQANSAIMHLWLPRYAEDAISQSV